MHSCSVQKTNQVICFSRNKMGLDVTTLLAAYGVEFFFLKDDLGSFKGGLCLSLCMRWLFWRHLTWRDTLDGSDTCAYFCIYTCQWWTFVDFVCFFLYINFCQYINIYDTDTPYITCHLCHTISSKCYFETTGICRDPFKQSSDLGWKSMFRLSFVGSRGGFVPDCRGFWLLSFGAADCGCLAMNRSAKPPISVSPAIGRLFCKYQHTRPWNLQ